MNGLYITKDSPSKTNIDCIEYFIDNTLKKENSSDIIMNTILKILIELNSLDCNIQLKLTKTTFNNIIYILSNIVISDIEKLKIILVTLNYNQLIYII